MGKLESTLPESFRAFCTRNAQLVGATEASARAISVALLLAASLGVVLLSLRQSSPKGKQPPCLREPIPYITNLYQYWNNMKRFLVRLDEALKHSSVVKVHLGPSNAYVVRGAANIKDLFRTGNTSIIEDDALVTLLAEGPWGFPKKDCAKIRKDKSGRSKKPNLGSERLPEKDRFFLGQHHIYTEYLMHSRSSNRLAEVFYGLLSEKLDTQPVGTWRTLNLFKFSLADVTEAAIRTLLGSQLFEQHSDVADAVWGFDTGSVLLYFGIPRWLNSQPYKARERLNRIMRDYIRLADQFDWDGPDAQVEWDKRSGARVSRELVKFFTRADFDEEGVAGFFGTLLIGENANSVRIATWALMEAVRDPDLLQALQKEVSQAFAADHTLDVPKLLSLPLLQSVYTETLRLHMSFNLPRSTREEAVLDGYHVPRGSLILAPMEAAHLDETIWGSEGHPASDFWAGRHLKYTESVDQTTGQSTVRPGFSMEGVSAAFFPFGGGSGICPGRHFAKQEILMIIAILLAKFDVEFVGWVKMDGTRSDRPARDDGRFAGMAAMPPDRDMKVRLRRRW